MTRKNSFFSVFKFWEKTPRAVQGEKVETFVKIVTKDGHRMKETTTKRTVSEPTENGGTRYSVEVWF